MNVENRKKIRRRGIANTVGRRYSQTQKQRAEHLGVSQKAVSGRLQEMGKIRETGRWVGAT